MNMDTSDGSYRGRGRSAYRGSSRGGGGGGRSNDQYYSSGGGGRGGGGQGYQSGGYNQSYGNFNQSYRGSSRGRGYWGGRGRSTARGGRTARGDPGRGGRGGSSYTRGQLPEDVESLSELKGHTKKVTCLVLDQATGQLFTGSHDSTVRVWSCSTGECTSTVQVGGEVDSMLIEAGFLFVGVKTANGQGVIKSWNMATNAEFHLEGHTGRVQCLAAASGMLFSGGQDQSIRVWKPNPATGAFECAAVLRVEHGGHAASTSAMCASGPFLFSGDFLGTIKVWDLAAGAVRQSLDNAHSGGSHPAITSMLVWEGHLITGALDGTIKVWEPSDPSTGQVINPVPAFTFPESAAAAATQDQQLYSRSSREKHGRSGAPKEDLPGVLAMCGVADPQGKAVVMVAYNGEKAIKLFEMPTFIERGQLWDVHNVRSMAGFAAGRLMISGDEHGRLKVWRWKEQAASTPFA